MSNETEQQVEANNPPSPSSDRPGNITDYQLTEFYEDVILFDDLVKENNNYTYNFIRNKKSNIVYKILYTSNEKI